MTRSRHTRGISVQELRKILPMALALLGSVVLAASSSADPTATPSPSSSVVIPAPSAATTSGAGPAANCSEAVNKAAAETVNPPKCSCIHATAMCVPLAPPSDKGACVYLVNAFGSDLKYLQMNGEHEDAFVANVLKSPRDRFFQVGASHISDEHVSQDGVIVVRAFGENGVPLALDALDDVSVKVNGEDVKLLPAGGGQMVKTIFLNETLSKTELGASVEVELTVHDLSKESRYAWYRPRNGWAVDYTLAAFAFSWSDWHFKGEPEKSLAPVLVELEYRYYHSDGGFYLFPSLAIGPNLVLGKAEKDDNGKSASGDQVLNGLIGALALDVNGFKLGFGVRWAWKEGNMSPMVTLALTEAIARGLGFTEKYPSAIAGGK